MKKYCQSGKSWFKFFNSYNNLFFTNTKFLKPKSVMVKPIIEIIADTFTEIFFEVFPKMTSKIIYNILRS